MRIIRRFVLLYCVVHIAGLVLGTEQKNIIGRGTVPSIFSRLKAARALPIILAALTFADCNTQAPDQSAARMQGTAQADSGFYL